MRNLWAARRRKETLATEGTQELHENYMLKRNNFREICVSLHAKGVPTAIERGRFR